MKPTSLILVVLLAAAPTHGMVLAGAARAPRALHPRGLSHWRQLHHTKRAARSSPAHEPMNRAKTDLELAHRLIAEQDRRAPAAVGGRLGARDALAPLVGLFILSGAAVAAPAAMRLVSPAESTYAMLIATGVPALRATATRVAACATTLAFVLAVQAARTATLVRALALAAMAHMMPTAVMIGTHATVLASGAAATTQAVTQGLSTAMAPALASSSTGLSSSVAAITTGAVTISSNAYRSACVVASIALAVLRASPALRAATAVAVALALRASSASDMFATAADVVPAISEACNPATDTVTIRLIRPLAGQHASKPVAKVTEPTSHLETRSIGNLNDGAAAAAAAETATMEAEMAVRKALASEDLAKRAAFDVTPAAATVDLSLGSTQSRPATNDPRELPPPPPQPRRKAEQRAPKTAPAKKSPTPRSTPASPMRLAVRVCPQHVTVQQLLLEFQFATSAEEVFDRRTGERKSLVLIFPANHAPGPAARRNGPVARYALQPVIQPMRPGAGCYAVNWSRPSHGAPAALVKTTLRGTNL